MTVYVDDMKASFGRMVMCHMLADTTEELNAMADKIGVSRKWIQETGTYHEHYDIAKSKRSLAVKHGAKGTYKRRTRRLIGKSQTEAAGGDAMNETTITLSVYWSPSNGENRNTRFGKVEMDTGYPITESPLTQKEMQDIAYAAKMAFGKIMRNRKKEPTR